MCGVTAPAAAMRRERRWPVSGWTAALRCGCRHPFDAGSGLESGVLLTPWSDAWGPRPWPDRPNSSAKRSTACSATWSKGNRNCQRIWTMPFRLPYAIWLSGNPAAAVFVCLGLRGRDQATIIQRNTGPAGAVRDHRNHAFLRTERAVAGGGLIDDIFSSGKRCFDICA